MFFCTILGRLWVQPLSVIELYDELLEGTSSNFQEAGSLK